MKMNTPMKNVSGVQPPPQQAPEPEPEAPVLVLPGLGQVQARSMVIASVHFESRQMQFFHSSRKIFCLPAAGKGEVKYLRIFDGQQLVPSWPDFQQPPEFSALPVAVETIADDLERNWGNIRSKSGNHRLGIGRIVGDACTPQELEKLMKWQEQTCKAFVHEADKLAAEGKAGDINAFHRSCLTWLGSEQRPWMHEIQLGVMKIGPSGNRIPMTALIDTTGTDLIDYYNRHNLDPAEFGDDHIAQLFARNPSLRKKPASA